MDKQDAAKKFIELYNQSNDSMAFTKVVYGLKSSDPELYNAIINELKNGSYKVNYLNSYWTRGSIKEEIILC